MSDDVHQYPRELPATATCLTCGYVLRGLPTHICPECGRAFDPDDWTTYDDPAGYRARKHTKRIRNWQKWVQPPSRAKCVGVAAATVFLLVDTDVSLFVLGDEPGDWSEFVVGLAHLVAVLVLAFAMHGRLRAIDARRRLRRVVPPNLEPRPPQYTSRVVWLCGFVGIPLMFGSPRFAIQFALSRSALEAAAAAQLKVGVGAKEDRWIGLMHTTGISLHNGGQVFFDLDGSNFGLLFEPRGRAWEAPHRLILLNGGWSLASFSEPYTLIDLLLAPLPSKSR